MPEYEAMEAFVRYDPGNPSHLYKSPRPDHEDPEHLALKAQEGPGGLTGTGLSSILLQSDSGGRVASRRFGSGGKEAAGSVRPPGLL